MAQSVTRRIERNLTASVAFEPGQLIRPRSAESIKASGYVRPRRKAGHMTASDHCSSRKKFLQAGGQWYGPRPRRGGISSVNCSEGGYHAGRSDRSRSSEVCLRSSRRRQPRESRCAKEVASRCGGRLFLQFTDL